MKKKHLLLVLSLITLNANQLFAADRVVQQNGPGGTYASISAAISAASDGDNIIINNRTDALPWVENLTINKSLTFVSAVDNVQWWMEGTISITLAEARTITIVGMKNTSASGSITKTGTIPTNRTNVNLLYCDINGANVTLSGGVNLYMGSCKARIVTYSFGKIIGNDLGALAVNSDNATSEDVNLIVGNRMGIWTPSSVTTFNYNSNTQYLYASNNYVKGSYHGGAINTLKSGTVGNRIINCVFASINSGYIGLEVTHTSGQLTLENNIFAGYYVSSSTGSPGIVISSSSSALVTATYNMFYNHPNYTATTLSTSLNNFAGSTSAYSSNIAADGSVIGGTAHINSGSPANEYLDLDLTRNDVGAYGGSYSMANFLPLMNNTESSRVNYMTTPRVVNQGGTVNATVIGFDK